MTTSLGAPRVTWLRAALCALTTAALLLPAAAPASAQGTIEWVEVRLDLDPAGKAAVAYKARWRTSGTMHGFFFQGEPAAPTFLGGTAELPDGSNVPLAIEPAGDGRWDIVRRPAEGTPQERYRARFGLNLPLQSWDAGTAFGNAQVGICYSCHSASQPHRGEAESSLEAGCLDCHDEHAENAGDDRFMLPRVSKGTGSYAPAKVAAAPGPLRYATPRLDPASGEPSGEDLDFVREDGIGVCDNEACNPAYAPMADHISGRDHSGGRLAAGKDCGKCHPHLGDPVCACRATGHKGA